MASDYLMPISLIFNLGLCVCLLRENRYYQNIKDPTAKDTSWHQMGNWQTCSGSTVGRSDSFHLPHLLRHGCVLHYGGDIFETCHYRSVSPYLH